MSLYKKLIFLSFILLNACGFEPLYRYNNNAAGISDDLSLVYIEPIEGRIGQLVKNKLCNRLNMYGSPANPLYYLKINIEEPKIKQAVSLDNTVSREALLYEATYELLNKNGKQMVEGEATAEASYSILSMPYGTSVSKDDALERASVILSDDIALRLSVYFKNINQ